MTASSPYQHLPERSFWRPAVAARHWHDIREIWSLAPLRADDKLATAGSCFAQHIGRHLRRRGACYLDLEPPPAFLPDEVARRHGFLIYSCRYGNIYTARQLHQLALEALGRRTPDDRVWSKDHRFYDALRPSVDPVGHDRPDDVLRMRDHHLSCVRRLLEQVDVFVFTLGLTEAWESSGDCTVYPTAPGTIAGSFDASRYRFRNFRYPEVMADLQGFWGLLRECNPSARMILTVSPVPLTATASDDHVVVATTQSKATLRAVAGDMAALEEDVAYFPSFELISAHPARAMFFNPDLRTVNSVGVDYVMSHFFGDLPEARLERSSLAPAPRVAASGPQRPEDDVLICDEELLEEYASSEEDEASAAASR